MKMLTETYRALIDRLDEQRAPVPGKQVRHVCEWIYGEQINDRRWRRWRNLADAGLWAQNYTWGEAMAMVSIAYLRSLDPTRKLTQQHLIDLLVSTKPAALMTDALDFFTENGIYGRDLHRVLTKLGKPISERTLRRKVPGFSRRKRYFKREIDQILSA